MGEDESEVDQEQTPNISKYYIETAPNFYMAAAWGWKTTTYNI